MTPAGLDADRAVQLLITKGGEVVKVGSGYLAADGLVLTAAHVVAGAEKVTVRRVIGRRQVQESAGDTVWADAEADIAVVRLDDDATTDTAAVWAARPLPLRYGRVDGEVGCEALGFPRFKLRREGALAAEDARQDLYRDTHQAIGRITPLSNRRQGTLEITVPPPEHDADPLHSPWEGMSGAAVFAGGALVGVICEHYPSDGLGRLAARPVSQWYGLPAERLDGLRALLRLPEQKRLEPIGRTPRIPAWQKWTAAFVVGGAVVFGALYLVGRHNRPALTVTVQTQESVVDNGAWYFPGTLMDSGATLSDNALTDILAKRSDKVDTYETKTLVTVEGGSHTVGITGMHIKILSRTTPAPGGTLLVDPSQGEDATIKIGFDLDETTPVARRANPEDPHVGSRYFDGSTDTAKPGEMLSFGITFQAATSDVTYDLVLEEVVDGKVRQQLVTDNGRPFHTRGFASRYDQAVGFGPGLTGWVAIDRAKAIDEMCGTTCATPTATPAAASTN